MLCVDAIAIQFDETEDKEDRIRTETMKTKLRIAFSLMTVLGFCLLASPTKSLPTEVKADEVSKATINRTYSKRV